SNYLYTEYSVLLFNPPPTPQISTLSLHDALPISAAVRVGIKRLREVGELSLVEVAFGGGPAVVGAGGADVDLFPAALADVVDMRSEEHTSELQSRSDLVCRLLLEKKKAKIHHLSS